MKIIARILDRFEERLIAFLIAAATLIIVVAVAHRHAAGLPIRWCRTGWCG